jgi:hypothetical protein
LKLVGVLSRVFTVDVVVDACDVETVAAVADAEPAADAGSMRNVSSHFRFLARGFEPTSLSLRK